MSVCILLMSRCLVLLATTLLVTCQNGPSSWTTSPFSPPALPLAVRSPYLNTWLPQGFGPTQLNVHTLPNFWNIDNTVTGWYASVVVDGKAYLLVGTQQIPNVQTANQTAIEFTPTRTSFFFSAGPMKMNVTFISPVEPTDLVRQSLPFSYLSISASSSDGNSHSIQMYSDITGEFIAGDTSQIANWSSDTGGDYVVLSMQLQTPNAFSEINSFAQDATEYYAFKKIDGTTTTWAIAEDTINRGIMANTSSLGNTSDSNFRAVSTVGKDQPVIGIAVDWGELVSTPEPAVWAIGVVRSPSIQYQTASGSVEERYPYFLSTYNDASAAAKAFLDDFSRAQSASAEFDAQLASASSQISTNYSDLISLTTRQAMGCIDITLSKTGNGEWNTSDVMIFMKNMGGAGSDSLGASMSVNTVDTLYAAFPMFIYLNPELGGYLLSPLLEFQDSEAYTLDYAAKNIGSTYPNATADGINNDHEYGIEETANMLIMTLAYSQASGNGTLLRRHYGLLRKWGEYLGNNSLIPINQSSPDFSPTSGLSNNNQTNTALKGIIGIAAMAKIAEIMIESEDHEFFNSTANSYISTWQNEALASDQTNINFIYGNSSTNGIIYNLYADKLLQLGLVSGTVYEALNHYLTTTNQNKFGIPLNNDQPFNSSTNGIIFAASASTSSETRNALITQLHEYATSNDLAPGNFYPLITNYNPASGAIINANGNGANSPAQGAMFSVLALNVPIKQINSGNISSPPNVVSPPTKQKKKSEVGAIIGGVIAGGAIICIIVAVSIWRRKTRLRPRQVAHIEPMKSISTAPSGASTDLPTISSTSKGPSPSTDPLSQPPPSNLPFSKTPMIQMNTTVRRMTPLRKPALDLDLSEPSGSATTRTVDDNIQPSLGNDQRGETVDSDDSREVRSPADFNWREEVENLRRVIERMRENGMDPEDAPPSYSDPGLP